ncbi:MAG: GNAT family N-acetyltransferase [Sphingomicrobium sp.]
MTIRYRAATPADLVAIDEIFRTSFCDTFAHLYHRDDLAAFLAQFTPALWASELGDRQFAFRIAEDAGRIIGFAKLGPPNLPVATDAPRIELRQMYLLKEWHGQGIAGELMDWVIAEAKRRAARELYLTVYIDNHRARRLYERFGFVVVGRYDFMVGNHADEDTIMRLDL